MDMNEQSFGGLVFEKVSEAIFLSHRILYGTDVRIYYQTSVKPSSKFRDIDRTLSLRIEPGGAPFSEVFDRIFHTLLFHPSITKMHVHGKSQAEYVDFFKVTESTHRPDLPVSLHTTWFNVYNLGDYSKNIASDISIRLIHAFTPDDDTGPLLYKAKLDPGSHTISPIDQELYSYDRKPIKSISELYMNKLRSGESKTERYGSRFTDELYAILRALDESGLSIYLEDEYSGLAFFCLHSLDVKIEDEISFKLHSGIKMLIS